MKTTSPVFASLLVTAMLSGCALSGAGAGIFGAPTQTAGQTPAGSTASDKDKKPSEPANKANAGKPVDKVTTSANDLVILVKKTQKAQATVTYLDGSKDGDVQWVSKDSTIVQVNPTTGDISGVAPGTATIYARSNSDPDNKFAIINVTVKEGVVQDLSASVDPATSTLSIGDTVQLNASITNSSTATHPNGSWSTSNQQVAFVNDTGLVSARKAGKATITFQSDQNSTVRGSATITVTDPNAPAPTPSTK